MSLTRRKINELFADMGPGKITVQYNHSSRLFTATFDGNMHASSDTDVLNAVTQARDKFYASSKPSKTGKDYM